MAYTLTDTALVIVPQGVTEALAFTEDGTLSVSGGASTTTIEDTDDFSFDDSTTDVLIRDTEGDGTLTETARTTASDTPGESATLGEAFSLSASLPAADSFGLSDNAVATAAVAINASDSLSLTDAELGSASILPTESGAFSESGYVQVSGSDTESLTTAEGVLVAATLPDSDRLGLSDREAAAAALLLTESGTLADASQGGPIFQGSALFGTVNTGALVTGDAVLAGILTYGV